MPEVWDMKTASETSDALGLGPDYQECRRSFFESDTDFGRLL